MSNSKIQGKLSWFSPQLAVLYLIFSNPFYLIFATLNASKAGDLETKAGEDIKYQIILIISYFIILYNVMIKNHNGWHKLLNSYSLQLMIFSALISYFLAGVPEISMARFLMYIFTILLGLYISIDYVLEDALYTFKITSAFVILVHFLLYPLLHNTILYDQSERNTLFGIPAYAGLFAHKNIAAVYFGLAMIVALPNCLSGSKTKLAFFVFIGAFIGIVLSGAVGPLFSVILSIMVGYQVHLLSIRSYSAIGYSILIAGLISIFVIVVGIDSVLSVFNRSSDLTGRDFLFQMWPKFFFERPAFGFGFNGFFSGVEGAPAERLWEVSPWHTHFVTFESSYLEILLQFGVVGGVTFAFIISKGLINCFSFAMKHTVKHHCVPFMMLLFVLTLAASQTDLVLHNNISVVILFWTYFGFTTSEQLKFRICDDSFLSNQRR